MFSKTRKKTKKKVTAKKASKKVVKKTVAADKAHQPGHRKMKIPGSSELPAEKNSRQDQALNDLTRADLVRRKNSNNRRIITGAAIGKTGRITIKD